MTDIIISSLLILSGIFIGIGLKSAHRVVRRLRNHRPRAILARVQDGPDAGRLVAIGGDDVLYIDEPPEPGVFVDAAGEWQQGNEVPPY